MLHQNSTSVIDMCGIYFDPESWEAYLRLFAERAPGYLRTFAYTLANRAHVSTKQYMEALALSPHKAVDTLICGDPLDLPIETHVEMLRHAGIVRQVVHGIASKLADGTNVNTRLSQLTAEFPEVMEVWAGLDVADIDEAIAELERCTFDLKLRGASIVHWWSGRGPRDPECHKLYGRAAELGVPLWLHTGSNFASNQPFNFCSWADIDHIAVAHPDLTIVAGHGGWPWIIEAMAVLQRHRNVYLDISAHRPRNMAKQGSGWEPLLNFGRHVVQNKIVFGSVTWVHTLTIDKLAGEVRELGLGEKTCRAWLHDNAKTILEATREHSSV